MKAGRLAAPLALLLAAAAVGQPALPGERPASAQALLEDPSLSHYSGFVQDSGEGRWTINTAIEEAVPADVLSSALYARFRSRQEHTFAEKILSAMRHKFGGHTEPPKGGKG